MIYAVMDERQSGKTTKMLQHAVNKVFNGENVDIITRTVAEKGLLMTKAKEMLRRQSTLDMWITEENTMVVNTNISRPVGIMNFYVYTEYNRGEPDSGNIYISDILLATTLMEGCEKEREFLRNMFF